MSARRALPVLCCALVVAGCTRSRTSFPDGESPFVGASASDGQASITIERPAAGATVSSPVKVAGTVVVPPGRTVAAQVRSPGPDGELRWLGNDSLTVDDAGRFEGEISYVLDADALGIVEVLVIHPASGTVLERQEVAVNLQASPWSTAGSLPVRLGARIPPRVAWEVFMTRGLAGIDPLSDHFTIGVFASLIQRHPHLGTRAFLLDHDVLTPIDEVNANRVLAMSQLAADVEVGHLSEAEMHRLHRALRDVLGHVLEGHHGYDA